jgi:hypothetical protein
MPWRRVLVIAAIVLAVGIVVVVATSDDNEALAPSWPPGPRALVPTGKTVSAVMPDRAGQPVDLQAQVGDLVRLIVRGTAPGTATYGARYNIQPVDALTPARFEFVAEQEGRFPVRLLGSRPTDPADDKVVGYVEVGPPPAASGGSVQ